MKELRNIADTRLVKSYLGRDYTLVKKILLKGTGSPKVSYLGGIDQFSKITSQGSSISYLSIQLLPGGLVLRLVKDNKQLGMMIFKDDIHCFNFESRRIKVKTKYSYKIVHDALIDIEIKGGDKVKLYSPVAFYEPFKLFFRKDWLQDKVKFSLNPEPPINDHGSMALGILGRLLN